MEITYRAQPKGYDHELILADGQKIGFRGLKSGAVGLDRCPECKRENYAMAVLSGVCCWCGFDVKPLTERSSDP